MSISLSKVPQLPGSSLCRSPEICIDPSQVGSAGAVLSRAGGEVPETKNKQLEINEDTIGTVDTQTLDNGLDGGPSKVGEPEEGSVAKSVLGGNMFEMLGSDNVTGEDDDENEATSDDVNARTPQGKYGDGLPAALTRFDAALEQENPNKVLVRVDHQTVVIVKSFKPKVVG